MGHDDKVVRELAEGIVEGDDNPTAALIVARAYLASRSAERATKLWLWKNFVDGRPEYWAFDNPYPTHGGGDPITLGEPCGYAIFKESTVATGRKDVPESEVIAAIKRTSAPSSARDTDLAAEIERAVKETHDYGHAAPRIWIKCDDALKCAAALRASPSATSPSKEDTYRRAFALALAAALAGGWLESDPKMKARVVAYLHSANLDEPGSTCEKILHDAMGLPTDAERAYANSATHAACEHKNQNRGYSRTYEMVWCDDCGKLLWCSDGLIPDDKTKNDDYGAWCQRRVIAWGCKSEADGGAKCSRPCGYCVMSLHPSGAKTEGRGA